MADYKDYYYDNTSTEEIRRQIAIQEFHEREKETLEERVARLKKELRKAEETLAKRNSEKERLESARAKLSNEEFETLRKHFR